MRVSEACSSNLKLTLYDVYLHTSRKAKDDNLLVLECFSRKMIHHNLAEESFPPINNRSTLQLG